MPVDIFVVLLVLRLPVLIKILDILKNLTGILSFFCASWPLVVMTQQKLTFKIYAYGIDKCSAEVS